MALQNSTISQEAIDETIRVANILVTTLNVSIDAALVAAAQLYMTAGRFNNL